MTNEELISVLVGLGFENRKPNPMNVFETALDVGGLGQIEVWSRDGKEIIAILSQGDESTIIITTTEDARKAQVAAIKTMDFAREMEKEMRE